MQSNAVRAAVGVGAVALVVALFLVLRGDEESEPVTTPTPVPGPDTTAQPGSGAGEDGRQGAQEEPSEPPVPVVEVKGGEPLGGVKELTFNSGDEILLEVRSDVAEEVHLHGYDVSKPVKAGGTVSFSVPAELEGVFELELEQSGVTIAEISVTP